MVIRKIKNLFHLLEAVLADIFYGFPSRKIKVIGVTGTDGKTTTTHAIHHLLKSSGKSASMISSIYAEIGGRTVDTGFHTTTPRPWAVRSFLHEAVRAGSEYFVLETTSHSIDQNRVWGIPFEVAVLTNITQEHSLHHASFDDYVMTKTKLLLQAKKPLINADAAIFDTVKKILNSHNKQFSTFSLSKKDATFVWNKQIKTEITEDFNKQNVLAAYSCCMLLGLEEPEMLDGINTFILPKGRVEVVYDQDFTVIVDFAHTPHAIYSVLNAISEKYKSKNGRLIHVFGSASQRDDVKRPMMGQASGKFADIVILTEEDHRTEDVEKICDEIGAGLINSGFQKESPEQIKKSRLTRVFCVVTNREKAIELAIDLAAKGDIVVTTGKSHEKSLARGKKEYPWDEFKAIESALKFKKF
jgi:UDP-N-acetylmuramoyl-L-alanyl-D-glutamate--2,6-diaminopimelate ligase